ncbi:MAG: tetraacyldisaccharide 4'-kinase [Pseudobdellovibrionaceae bacterium]
MKLKNLSSPLGRIYGALSSFRNSLYDKKLIKTIRVPAKVISVGNLTVGGSGKTPIVLALLKVCRERNVSTVVVSRNYKADAKLISRVSLEESSAKMYGDEPYMIAKTFPDVPVYVGPSKSEAARWAYEIEKPEMIIVDDGFQHRRLNRDFDIVLIDSSKDLEDLNPLPWGRGREWVSSLKRAHLILFTKSQSISEEKKNEWLKIVPTEVPSYFIPFEFTEFENLQTGDKRSKESLNGMQAVVACGIADPGSFLQMCKKQGATVVETLVYSDHYPFRSEDLKKIITLCNKSGADMALVTEKDAVKLKAFAAEFPEDAAKVWVAKLELKGPDSVQSIYEFLAQVSLPHI